MRTSSAQWGKEVRQMAWPWAGVMGVALFVAVRTFGNGAAEPLQLGPWRDVTEGALALGTFVGTALLAALPLGSEFQYRTLAQRLSQPIDRREVWRQKFAITIAAVAPPAAIFVAVLVRRDGLPFATMAAAWMLVTLFGAIPVTLLARSIIGAMVLNEIPATGITCCWMYYEKHHYFPVMGLWVVGVAVVAYVVVTTWLGRRMLLRFQAVDGMQAGEDFVPVTKLMPEAVTRWFECRPGQPIVNLVKREFRITRVLWLLIAIYLAAWAFLVVFRLVPDERTGQRYIAFAVTAIMGVIIAVLAGTLSLGEEKTAGTHEWHMTLPLSITTQWAVKLLFAVGSSVVGIALLPMGLLALGRWAGYPIGEFLNNDVIVGWVLEAAAVTLVAFWVACVVKGTVQATLWVFPIGFVVGLASEVGSWLLGRFDPTLQHWMARLVAWLDPIALGRVLDRYMFYLGFRNLAGLVIAPLLAIGLIQSLRMFRAQFGANHLRVVRFALPLIAVTFLWGAGSDVLFDVLRQCWHQSSATIAETDKAIGTVLKVTAGTNGPVRQISADDLAKATPLSPGTRRWLQNASITVSPAPDRGRFAPYYPGRIWAPISAEQTRDRSSYTALLHNTRDGDCRLTFQRQQGVAASYAGFVVASCE